MPYGWPCMVTLLLGHIGMFIEFPEKYKFIICCVQILFWMSKPKQFLYTTCSKLVFFGKFNEQYLVILWVNGCKNEGFWKRFTCTNKILNSRLLIYSKKVTKNRVQILSFHCGNSVQRPSPNFQGKAASFHSVPWRLQHVHRKNACLILPVLCGDR